MINRVWQSLGTKRATLSQLHSPSIKLRLKPFVYERVLSILYLIPRYTLRVPHETAIGLFLKPSFRGSHRHLIPPLKGLTELQRQLA